MMKLHAPSSIFVTEAIATQHDGFGERLETMVRAIVDELKANSSASITDKHPVVKMLEKAIFERFKLKVSIITDEHLAAILPFYSNKNHIFLPEFWRGQMTIRDQQKLLRAFDDRKGTVNLEKATLSGIFSEYDHPLYINFNVLVRHIDMSAAEITACILHELGHGFHACYYSDRTDRTNQVLANIARNLHSDKGGDIEYVYKELSTITPSITKESVDTMINGPKIVAGVMWFKTVVGVVKSQIDNDTYNKTSFEQSADNFASRFGYGKQIVIALDKLYQGTPEKNTAIFIISQTLEIMTFILLLAVIIGATSVVAGLGAVVMMFLKLTIARSDVKDMTYDEVKQRYLRIRMDAIDQLKHTKTRKDKVKEILESIYAMDLIVKETRVSTTIYSKLADFIFSGAREAKSSIEAQKMMEQLASNDLFMKSAEFKLMA